MSKSKSIYSLVCLVFLLQAPLVSADIEYVDIKNLEEKAVVNYEEKFRKLEQDAENGDTNAQYDLGSMYYNGQGVKQDYTKAIKWYTKSAENDNKYAQFLLGFMYYEGKNVKRDLNKAAEWLKKAADQGEKQAPIILRKLVPFLQYLRGQEYQDGKDYTEAIKWYKKSAEQGNKYALSALMNMYYHGEGVKQDYKKAFEWSCKAAKRGYAFAQMQVGVNYYNGNGVEQDYEKSRNWFTKAAIQGYVDAQLALSVIYLNGEGVTKDTAKAIEWFQKSEKEGNRSTSFYFASIKHEKIKKWADKLFDNRFDVYYFDNYEPIYLFENSNAEDNSYEFIRLHGNRLLKKIWIEVKVQLNREGSIKLDEDDKALCEIINKSQNLLDKDIKGACLIEPKNNNTWLDKIKDYAW